MKRFTFHTLILIALLSGCTKGTTSLTDFEPGISLSVSVPGSDRIVRTKVGEGVSSLNENVLKSVYYLLYKKAEEETDPTSAYPKLSGHFSGLESETRETGRMSARNVPINASVVNELFPSGTQQCRAVVVANPTASLITVLENNPSLADLRASVVSANFSEATPQSDFVMIYDELVEVSGRHDKTIMTVDAQLKRLADKITLDVTVADGFYDSVSGWYVPLCEGLKVTFCNAFSKTNLASDFSSLPKEESDWFESAEIGFGEAVHGTGADTTYRCSSSFPIYSYPMEWEWADKYEPYLLFELPWQNTGISKTPGTGRIQPFYYKIMLSAKKLDANAWYNIHVTLKILGSPNKVEPTQQYLYEDYQIYDWVNAFIGDYNNVDAEIREARYLMVNETNFVLNNQPAWNIPFASSHECEIVNATYVTTNYSSNPPVVSSPRSISGLTPSCTINISEGVVTFHKELRNDITASAGNYDYVPYDFTFTIRHIDNHDYAQTITIRQYPALYIGATGNSKGATVGDRSKVSNITTFVNNNSGTGGITISNLGGATNSATPGNNNGYMYVVSVSSLPETSDYIIMDPRVSDVNLLPNGLSDWTVTAPAMYEGTTNRTLRYYYPTYSDEAHENAIAPKFRVASSWGATQDVNFDNARRRCASYQEDGFPAGRWRVPTRAEVEFIIKLSSDGVIPLLFSNGSAYWCADGTVTPRQNSTPNFSRTTSNNHPVRCVYDEWYWEGTDSFVTNTNYATTGGRMDSSKYTTFVWGDMPR